jgi:hypothetical protein
MLEVKLDNIEVNITESNLALERAKSGSLFLNFIKNKLIAKLILYEKIMPYFLV